MLGQPLKIAAALMFSFAPLMTLAADTSPTQILEQAEAQKSSYLKTLEQLVSIDTGTGQEEGINKVQEILVDRLKSLGADVSVTPASPSVGGNIVGTIKGSGKARFLLMVHYDTVFGPGTAAKRPFRADEARAYGPGVADAKGGVAMILHSLQLLKAQDFKQFGTITVLFNPDEETGSAGSRAVIADLARKHDYVFSYEPPDKEAVTVATNGINAVHLSVKGRASHAGSAPEEGRNAVIEMGHQLVRLKDLGNPAKGTTVNWTIVHGGDKRNIIPALAVAEGDMRYSDLSEYDRVLSEGNRLIQEKLVPDTEVSFRIDKGRPPLVKNSGSEQLAERAKGLYSAIGRTLEPVAMRFGTDAGYAYVPGESKPAILETMGVVGAGLHSPEEYIDLSSIAPRLYLTVSMIKELSEKELTGPISTGNSASGYVRGEKVTGQ
ncbi:M20/M25/M40 family metallo-hydrolase (plasmid) [Pseudomonas luteola]|uniref:Glutamate carboxypeptidase n=1 Tax=Pseudomonas luteola TaxID=47886 RepID=A0A2X2D9A7_PSELU|nr:M20/M25/M40 family metallo-hydrolase [Pseudomonas zeshuii]QEU26953.1 M20/M25/M40 family metallo-hydrolase [Pseudomonas luteola]SPZ16758.1 glutamate carboxypeptidase [Pseudomonas luteola]